MSPPYYFSVAFLNANAVHLLRSALGIVGVRHHRGRNSQSEKHKTQRFAANCRRVVLQRHEGQFVDPPPFTQCAQVLYSAAAAENQSASQLSSLSLVSQLSSWHRGTPCKATHLQHRECSLTLRSSGAPTAGCQARRPLWFILRPSGLAPCRRRPLSSNVRQHNPQLMFLTTVPHLTLPYAADRTFVVIGNTTWQTKNIAAVAIEKRQLPFDIPEPVFREPEPVAKTNWRYLIYGSLAVMVLTLASGGGLVLGTVLLMLLVGGVVFVRVFGHRNSLNQWTEQKAAKSKARKAWMKLRESVPSVYTLILDTSSGKSVALTTFEPSKIEQIREAILFAMSSESERKVENQLTAIDMENKKLDEHYTKYCLHQMS